MGSEPFGAGVQRRQGQAMSLMPELGRVAGQARELAGQARELSGLPALGIASGYTDPSPLLEPTCPWPARSCFILQ